MADKNTQEAVVKLNNQPEQHNLNVFASHMYFPVLLKIIALFSCFHPKMTSLGRSGPRCNSKQYLTKLLSFSLIVLICAFVFIQAVQLLDVQKHSDFRIPEKIVKALWLDQSWDEKMFTGNKGDVWKWQINWAIVGKLSNDSLINLWKDYPRGREFEIISHLDQSLQFTDRYWLRFQTQTMLDFRNDPFGFYSSELEQLGKYVCKYWNEIQYASELDEIDKILFAKDIDPSVSSVNVNPNVLLNTDKKFIGLKQLQIVLSVMDVTRPSGNIDAIDLWVCSCSVANHPEIMMFPVRL